MVGGWRGGREEFCCGVFNCLVGLPWAVLTPKQELSVLIFFCSSSPPGSPCGLTALSCSVTGHRGQIEVGSGGGGKGASAYQARGCLILRRHCLKGCRGRQRNWSDWKDLQNAKQGLAKRGGGGWLAVLTPTPTHYTLLFSYKRAVVVLALPP